MLRPVPLLTAWAVLLFGLAFIVPALSRRPAASGPGLDLLPTEGVSIGQAIAKTYKPVAEEKHKSGVHAGGKTAGKGRPKNSSRASCPTAKQDESARTCAVAAKAAGP